jgi:hypothetical protein
LTVSASDIILRDVSDLGTSRSVLLEVRRA